MDEAPSVNNSESSPWGLIQSSEVPSIGGSAPPSPAGGAVQDGDEDNDLHLFMNSGNDLTAADEFEGEPGGEAAWYGSVREQVPEISTGADGPSHLSRSSGSAEEVGLGPPLEDGSFARAAAAHAFKKLRLERPKQAWENHPVFARPSARSVLKTGFLLAPSVGVRETLNHPEPLETFGGEEASQIPWTIERRLKGVRIQRSDEDERNHSLKKLKALVLLDPLATALGKSLVRQTGSWETEEIIAASFSDAFSNKSSGTLTKRAGSLQRLVLQLYKQDVASPWRMSEADLYGALTVLREEGCGATAPLESLHFLHSVARFLHMDLEVVLSSRCRGVAHSCYISKAPLVQRDPLSCEQVEKLEQTMARAGPVVQCILGQILFCTHAVCRWKDAQRLKLLELLGTGESQIIFGDALGSKTSLNKEAKTRFTPYAALAQGLTECSWGRLWINARRECGIKFGEGPDGFALPTWSLRLDQWGSTPMGAAEATSWLLEFLGDSGTGRQLVGSHSLKVLAIYRSIRSGAFNPDLDPAMRVLQVANALISSEGRPEDGNAGQDEFIAEPMDRADGESDGSASDGAEVGPLELPGLPAVRAPFAEVDVARCRIHNVSGIAHCLRDEDYFYCGRMCTPCYSKYSGVGADDPDVCIVLTSHERVSWRCQKQYSAAPWRSGRGLRKMGW
ncbi:unnamed protein product [Symbiodinium sp. CCMP2456]|nr:unnamed protein product [Symbiodinium sp. CCMP2456]